MLAPPEAEVEKLNPVFPIICYASEESSQGPLNGGNLGKVSHKSIQPDFTGHRAPVCLMQNGFEQGGFSVSFFSCQHGLFSCSQGQVHILYQIPVFPVQLYCQIFDFQHLITSCTLSCGQKCI